MNRYICTLAFAGFFTMLQAQQRDSLNPRVLEAIVVQGVQPETDTLQSFYRTNTSATTESILSRMKGVSLLRRGAYGQEPVFRSLSGGQLNVTIDGMKIFGACADRMDPVTIYVEPQNLSSLQATLGTEGAAYGSTFGGTLNMKLAQARVGSDPVKIQAGLDYQTAASAFNSFTHAGISRQRSAYRVSATYRNSNNYRAGGGETVSFSQYEKVNIALTGKWTLGKYDTLQGDALYDRGWNIGFPALPMDVSKATAGIFAATWHRAAPLLIFHHFSLKAYHNNIRHNMNDRSRKSTGMYMDMPGRSQTSGILAEANIHVFHEHQTLVKAEYYVNRLLGEMTMYPEEGPVMYMQTAPQARRQNAGLFISQRLRIDHKNKLSFSLRGDLTNDHLGAGTGLHQWQVFNPDIAPNSIDFAWTATAVFKHKLSDNAGLELQTGYGQRIATLNEKFGYYLFNRFDRYDYIGNPDLANEASWNTELTFQFFGQHVEWQLTPFYQAIQNFVLGKTIAEIRPMTPGAFGTKQYTNLSSATLQGLDLMMLVRPLSNVQGIGSLKYTHGETTDGHPLPLIPPLKSVMSLRYDPGTFHLQMEWEWSASQNRVSESTGEQPTPAFSILSLRTGWKLNSLWYLNTGVENLLDERYREHLDWGGIPRPGRNVYLNFIYTFGK